MKIPKSQKILFLSLLLFSGCMFLFSQNVGACDFTSLDCKIDINALDPINNNTNVSAGERGEASFRKLLGQISDFLLMMIPVLAGVSLIVAGYFFVFSAGDGDRLNKGKNIIKFNLLAIVVAFLSWNIVNIIAHFFQ